MPAAFDRAAARAHLLGLAERHGIQVIWVSSWGKAFGWPGCAAVEIPRIRSGRDYLVALHEFGHVLSRESADLFERSDPVDEIACEGWAWAWAATNADPEIARGLSAREWQLVGASFVSYLRYAATSDPADQRYLDAEVGTAPAA